MAHIFKFTGGLLLVVATICLVWTAYMGLKAFNGGTSSAPEHATTEESVDQAASTFATVLVAGSIITFLTYATAAWTLGAIVYTCGCVVGYIESPVATPSHDPSTAEDSP